MQTKLQNWTNIAGFTLMRSPLAAYQHACSARVPRVEYGTQTVNQLGITAGNVLNHSDYRCCDILSHSGWLYRSTSRIANNRF